MVFRIEHRIGVAAPASEVWDLIYDLAGWKDWTELYTEASGTIRIGEKLRFVFQVGDRPPQTLEGVVQDWVPEAQMVWKVKFIGSWFYSLRYLEIEALSETNCILANGDYYFGPLAFVMTRDLRSAVRAGFQRMNENAKRISEERWAAKGGTVAPPADPLSSDGFSIQPLMQPSLTPRKFWGLGGGGPGLGPKALGAGK